MKLRGEMVQATIKRFLRRIESARKSLRAEMEEPAPTRLAQSAR